MKKPIGLQIRTRLSCSRVTCWARPDNLHSSFPTCYSVNGKLMPRQRQSATSEIQGPSEKSFMDLLSCMTALTQPACNLLDRLCHLKLTKKSEESTSNCRSTNQSLLLAYQPHIALKPNNKYREIVHTILQR